MGPVRSGLELVVVCARGELWEAGAHALDAVEAVIQSRVHVACLVGFRGCRVWVRVCFLGGGEVFCAQGVVRVEPW